MLLTWYAMNKNQRNLGIKTCDILFFYNFLQLRTASNLNFRNSDPAVVYKLSQITSQHETSEANNRLGMELDNEANGFLQQAKVINFLISIKKECNCSKGDILEFLPEPSNHERHDE